MGLFSSSSRSSSTTNLTTNTFGDKQLSEVTNYSGIEGDSNRLNTNDKTGTLAVSAYKGTTNLSGATLQSVNADNALTAAGDLEYNEDNSVLVNSYGATTGSILEAIKQGVSNTADTITQKTKKNLPYVIIGGTCIFAAFLILRKKGK